MSNDINQDIAKELVSHTAGKTYDDLAHPTAHATGQIVSFIPRTVKVWLGKWEKWILNGEYAIKETEKLLAEKLKNVPEEKITEPELYVAIPTLQQLSYSLDSGNLRELYANLLASSMNTDAKSQVHPAFVDIIKQLSPDDARLLKYLNATATKSMAIVDIEMRINGDVNGVATIVKSYSNKYNEILQNSQDYLLCVENLMRLKLCEIPGNSMFQDELYDEILNDSQMPHRDWVDMPMKFADGKSIIVKKIKKLSLNITTLGKAFADCCVV